MIFGPDIRSVMRAESRRSKSHGLGSRAFQLPSTSSDCSLTLDALNDEGRANDALLDALDGELALCALLSLQTAQAG